MNRHKFMLEIDTEKTDDGIYKVSITTGFDDELSAFGLETRQMTKIKSHLVALFKGFEEGIEEAFSD